MENHFALAENFQDEPEKSIIRNIKNNLLDRDYDGIENCFDGLMQEGVFDSCINNVIQTRWAKADGHPGSSPGPRASYSSCIDNESQIIYIHGGYNYDWLSDFWSFDIIKSQWTKISSDTGLEGGPSQRAFHVMCLDGAAKDIYFLGRTATDSMIRDHNYRSDFYVYNIISGIWTKLSQDTHADGGPKLLVAHQLAFDAQKNDIYVYGGKIITEFIPQKITLVQLVKQSLMFGGLYAYNTITKKWRIMFNEGTSLNPVLFGRMNHSMLFHPGSRKLFVFGGRRYKCHFLDLFTYNVDSGKIEICDSCSLATASFPTKGFHQATIDVNRDEIYVFTGAHRDEHYAAHEFWVYFINKDKWFKIPHRQPPSMYSRDGQILMYSQTEQKHYIFGGFVHCEKMFLGDLWSCEFQRMTREEYTIGIKKEIRRQKLEEFLSNDDLGNALSYLEQKITPLIMESGDPHQIEIFTSRFLFQNHDIENFRSNLFSFLVSQIIQGYRHKKGIESIIGDIFSSDNP